MSEQWYLRHQGKEVGPLAEEQLMQMAADGQVASAAEIRKEGTDRWVTAIRVKGLFPEALDAPPVAAPPSDDTAPPPLPTASAKAGSAQEETAEDQGNSLWDNVDLDELSQISTSAPQAVTASSRPAVSPQQSSTGGRKRWLVVLSVTGLVVSVATVAILVLTGSRGNNISQRAPDTTKAPEVASTDPAATGIFPSLPSGNQLTNPLTASQPDRRELRAGIGIRLGNLSFVVDHLWVQETLSTPTAGNPKDNATTEQIAKEPVATAEPAARFLFIKLTLRSGDTGFRYSSWNGTGQLGPSVIAQLTDATDTPLTLVPLEKTPTEPRKSSFDLAARSVASDVLVFTLPAAVTGEIRLQLPQEALGLNGPPLRFRISPTVLANSRRPNAAPSNTLAGSPSTAGDPQAPTPNGAQPESATDLLRNINRPTPANDGPPLPERTRPATTKGPPATPLDKKGKKGKKPAAGAAKQNKPGLKKKSKRKSKSPKPRIENKFNPF